MENIRIDGSIELIGDDFVVIKFPKGHLFYSDNNTSYNNFSDILVLVDEEGKFKDVTHSYPFLVNKNKEKGSEIHNYMLASILLWHGKALKKYIYEKLGVKDEITKS